MKLWDKQLPCLSSFFIVAEWLSSEPTLGSVCVSVVSPCWLPCQHVLTGDMLLTTTQLTVAVRAVFLLEGCIKQIQRVSVCSAWFLGFLFFVVDSPACLWPCSHALIVLEMFLEKIHYFSLLSNFRYQNSHFAILSFSCFCQKWLTVSKCFYQWISRERQRRGIKRTEGERRRKEIGGDKCCWDSRCSRKSCVFVTFLKERVAPALTGLHQQRGDVRPLRLVKDQRRHRIVQHSPYTADPLEGL